MNPPSPTTLVEPRVREILGGVAVFRLLALAWTFAVTVIDARSGVLHGRALAFGVLAALVLWTGILGVWAQSRPAMLLRPSTIAVDLALAAVTVATDWVVYDGPHPQSFGSAWPVAAVLSAAAILGWRAGMLAGAGIGAVNLITASVAGRIEGRVLGLAGSLVLLAVTGAVTGYVVDRLRRADSEIAEARAREEFARTLHDGVLQTLAVIQRRSDDASLVELAREQEWELRDFIGNGTPDGLDLVSALRHSAARTERHHGVRVDLIVVDVPKLPEPVASAIAGAAAEAITNAAKHALAKTVTVCVDEVDGGSGVVVTVNDAGRGFDVDTTPAGAGMTRSMRGRIEEAGGTVSVQSWPGRGTEVTLRISARPTSTMPDPRMGRIRE